MSTPTNEPKDAGTPAAKTAATGETDLGKVRPSTPPPTPAPAPVVKDDKWLDTEIAHTEDKLRTLREQKSASAPKSAPVAPAKKKTGWECEDLN